MSKQQEILSTAMALVESSEFMILASKSYRQRCIDQGFSEAVADMMALDFHHKLTHDIMKASS